MPDFYGVPLVIESSRLLGRLDTEHHDPLDRPSAHP